MSSNTDAPVHRIPRRASTFGNASWVNPKRWGFMNLFGGRHKQIDVASESDQASARSNDDFPFSIITVKELGGKKDAFNRFAGTQKQLEELNFLATPILYEDWDEYDRHLRFMPQNRPRFVMFQGPPGSGKTDHAREFARFMGMPLIVLNAASKTHLDTKGRSPFKNALDIAQKQLKSAVIILDELDTWQEKRFLAEVRQLIEGVERIENGSSIVIIGTCQDSSKVPPDLVDRASRIIHFGYFDDDKQRNEFWQKNARSIDTSFPKDETEAANDDRMGEVGIVKLVPKKDEVLDIQDVKVLKKKSGNADCGYLCWKGLLHHLCGTNYLVGPTYKMIESKGFLQGRKEIVYEIQHIETKEVFQVDRSNVHFTATEKNCDVHWVYQGDDMTEPEYTTKITIAKLREERDFYTSLAEASRGKSQRKLMQVAESVLEEWVTNKTARSEDGFLQPRAIGDPPLPMYLKALSRSSPEAETKASVTAADF